jgi:hypothetical protein
MKVFVSDKLLLNRVPASLGVVHKAGQQRDCSLWRPLHALRSARCEPAAAIS